MTPRVHLAARMIVLVGFVALGIAWLILGRVDASDTRLREAVAAGEVQSVDVLGRLDQPYLGFTTVEVRWRLHGIARSTLVNEVHCRNGTTTCPEAQGADRPSYADVVEGLQALSPDLRVEESDTDVMTDGTHTTLVFIALALTAAWILILAAGPDPRFATRWAWFWLLSAAPGIIPVVHVIGSAPLRPGAYPPPGPRPEGGRLTGGWAFLLASILASLLGTAASRFIG